MDGMNDSERFLTALAVDMPEDERLILCGFKGDPHKVGPTAWRPHPWRPGRDIVMNARDMNGYVTVSSFGRAKDGSFRRRTETFSAGRALMVDDVGTKVDPAIVAHAPPSAVVETSPGNFQWWYILSEPERDASRFDGVIRAFITGKLLGADPGMAGIARVGRIPGFLNAKTAYCTPETPDGFRVKLASLTEKRFDVDELLDLFELKIHGRRDVQNKDKPRLLPPDVVVRAEAFYAVYLWLHARHILKKDAPDWGGWTEMTCPWVDGHTDASDTGAAVREPAPDNGYHGAFRCHHGHCIDRAWKDLTDWVNDSAVEELDKANERASQ